jgi:hypothetical protein
MNLEELNPLERELCEAVVQRLCVNALKELYRDELIPKMAELTAAVSVGRE